MNHLSDERTPPTIDSWHVTSSSSREQEVGGIAPGEWFARPDHRQALRSLPEVVRVRIEINGCLAGAAESLSEAIREFALGWAFLHRFYSERSQIGTISGSSGRVAIMLDSGEDMDRLKLEAAGWLSRDDDIDDGTASSMRLPRTVPFVSQHDVIALSERAFARFDGDGRSSGLAFAALAHGGDLAVIARDVTARGAVAKIIGWSMAQDTDASNWMLVVTGLVDDVTVEGASRAGVGILITDAEPTAGAIRRARMLGTTVIGLVMSHRRSVFNDGGHMGDDFDPGNPHPFGNDRDIWA